MLRNISIGLAFFVLIICLILYGEHRGFEQGWELAGDFWNNRTADSPRFSSGAGPTNYGFLIERYLIIGCLLMVYLIAEFVRNKLVSKSMCFFSLGLIIYQYWLVYDWYQQIIKTYNFAYYSTDSFFRLIYNSSTLNWLCFTVVIILLLIQLTNISNLLYTKYKATPN